MADVTVPHRRWALVAARKAAGHTQESLASALEVDRSTVVRWEAGERTPLPFLQPRLARMLGQSPEQLRALINGRGQLDESGHVGGESSTDLTAAYDWLDQQAGWSSDTSRRKAAAQVARLDLWALQDRQRRRAKIGRRQVADALVDYYGSLASDVAMYRARCADQVVTTSIVSRSDWLDLARPLSSGNGEPTLADMLSPDTAVLDDVGIKSAVRRLVEAAALGVRIADVPIYRLLDTEMVDGHVGRAVGVSPFVQYALTVDLLETELIDAITGSRPDMPLRDKHLPDLRSVVDVSGRLCAGGILALCAIARPADRYRGAADYALLVQERSRHVVNAAGRLSVIPKGFHRPLVDLRADAHLGTTLRRKFEEELLGRVDLDNTNGQLRMVDPMHPSRLSEPMRWLLDDPSRLRMECTGFGLNLVSGNYEYASLIVIEDEEFWARFGGHVEANWESAGLRQYSSLNDHLVGDLIVQDSWSNEGLFAFLQGVRRLSEIDGERVSLPSVDVIGCS
jgi:transcriptional regulator with XRE-family HTH domain